MIVYGSPKVVLVWVVACVSFAALDSTDAFAQTNLLGDTQQVDRDSPPLGASMAQMLDRLEKAEDRLSHLESVPSKSDAESSKSEPGSEPLLGSDDSADESDSKESEPKAGEKPKEDEKPKEKAWYEKYRIRGYSQLRINDVPRLEPDSADAHLVGDSSVGDNQGFLIRRARLIIQGDVNEHVSIYLQPDFAITPPGSIDSNQFGQMRDWYADLHLDTSKEFRIRVGQSKIPYGWENMQSSSNRLPLDRADGTNSAARNERDLGVFFYWTPTYAQEFYQTVVDEGLKGSGNYGNLGFGFYNGQGGSFREQNDNLHFITRFNQPITFSNGQRAEIGVQAYTGKYVVLSSAISPLGVGPTSRPQGTLETGNDGGIRDERIGLTWVYYPQPLGFQAEWNVGRGPALNDSQTAVIEQDLHGGYAMTMYRIQTCNYGDWFPFYRYSYYDGGYKTERNAPMASIDEHELGLEWQINKYVELVSMYTFTDRTNTQAISVANQSSYDQFVGQMMRFQLQVSY